MSGARSFTSHTVKECPAVGVASSLMDWNIDGTYLATCPGYKQVKINQLDNATTLSAKTIHTIPIANKVTNLCWHATEAGRFAFCGDDKFVELWDVRSARATSKIATLGGNLNVAWSPDGNYIAVGNKSDYICLLDCRTNAVVKKNKWNYEVNDFKFTANSDHILAATGGDGIGGVDLFAWDEAKSAAAPSSSSFSSFPSSSTAAASSSSATAATGPAAAAAASAVEDPTSSLRTVGSLTAHTDRCMTLKLDSTRRRMLLCGTDFLVSLWDVEDLVCHHTILFESGVKSAAFSGDGRYIAAAAEEPAVAICDSSTGEYVAKISLAPKQNVMSLAWHPNISNSQSDVIAVSADLKIMNKQTLQFYRFSHAS